MNLEVDKVVTIKLNSGEELIARVSSIGETTITVSEPLSVAPSSGGMGLVPSMFTATHSELVEINKNSIMMWGPTELSIRDKYTEATTGIRLPSKRLVLG